MASIYRESDIDASREAKRIIDTESDSKDDPGTRYLKRSVVIPNAMWKPSETLWRVALEAPDERTAEIYGRILDDVADALSAFETSPGGVWVLSGLIEGEPDTAQLRALLAVASVAHDVAEPEITIERMPAVDWVRLNQESFPPLHIGRFFVYGSHIVEPVPSGATGLLIDAASAFGTGEHATTSGCLLALDRLAKRGAPRRILDMGTGTGILAIAAAKTWRVPVIAADLDRNSVRVAAENMRLNGVSSLVRCIPSDGYRSAVIARAAPYNLIMANILARPLAHMALDLARHLAPGGIAILSGLLDRQEPYVHAAHRAQGLKLSGRIARQGWHTLIYRKGTDRAPLRAETLPK